MESNEELVAEYSDWLRAWASDKTVHARTLAARAYLRSCGGLDGITPRSLQRYIAAPRRDGQPKSAWSRATYHGHMRSLCEFLIAGGYLTEDPMEGARSVKRPRRKPRPLSELDVERVLSAAKGDVRDWIVIGLVSGLRVSEIAKLRGEDVNADGIYVDGKGGLAVSLPAHPDVLEIARRMPSQGFWWPGSEAGHIQAQTITKRVGRLFASLGIKGSIHKTRHTYCTRLLREGVNVRVVQQLMRHASLETTAAYAAVSEDELSSAILRLPRVGPRDEPPTAA